MIFHFAFQSYPRRFSSPCLPYATWVSSMGRSYVHLGLKGASLQVALVALVVAPSFILLGYNQAVLGGGIFSLSSWVEVFPALDTIHKTGAELSYNSTTEGTCNASFQMGSFIGALSLSLYGEKLGRQKTVFIAAIISIVGQALQCSSKNLVQFVLGRVILGFSVGQLSGTVPVWQSECSSAERRGQHVICDGIFICTGYVLCNWIDVAFSNIPSSTIQWRIPLTIPIIFSFVLAFSVFALPESPRWLASKGKFHEATSSLAQYRGKVPTDPTVGPEVAEIKRSFESAEGASLRDIFRKDDKSRLQFRFWLCLGLNFFLQVIHSQPHPFFSSVQIAYKDRHAAGILSPATALQSFNNISNSTRLKPGYLRPVL